jgi:hypothetical protein
MRKSFANMNVRWTVRDSRQKIAVIGLVWNLWDCDWCKPQSTGNVVVRYGIKHKELLGFSRKPQVPVNVQMLCDSPQRKSSEEEKGKDLSPISCSTDDVLSFPPFRTGESNTYTNLIILCMLNAPVHQISWHGYLYNHHSNISVTLTLHGPQIRQRQY